jgi:hypothetical protein
MLPFISHRENEKKPGGHKATGQDKGSWKKMPRAAGRTASDGHIEK